MDTPPETISKRKTARMKTPRLFRKRVVQSDPSVTREEALAALAAVVASADFPASARNRRFLEHVVRHTLDETFEKISGYYVATEVFGRAADFNPTTDPIVRIEAAKLRRDLETYYLKCGSTAAVRISLPRGGYIPLFHRAVHGAGGAPALDPNGITVHTLHADGAALAHAGTAFRARVIDRLARQAGVSVFAAPTPASPDGLLDSDTARDLGRRNGTRFILSGDARPDGDGRAVVTARLHDGMTGRLLWSEDITGDAARLDELLVARTLATQREWAPKSDAISPSSALSG